MISFNLSLSHSICRDVDDIDFYIGGLAERSLPGAVLGPTFACIVARQFLDLKQGDRFYYENSPVQSAGAFTLPQLNEIRRMSLSNLICNNYEVESLQMNAFLLPDRDKLDKISLESFITYNVCFNLK